MRHLFKTEQWLPYPLESVFAFFANPANLPQLMPAVQRPRIEEAHIISPAPYGGPPSTPFAAGPESRITLSFRPVAHLPFRTSWQAEISSFAWYDHFCDTQLRGPFRFWQHCHQFCTERRGLTQGTLLRDVVEYEPPAGALGTIADKLFIERRLKALFEHRQTRTFELLSYLLSSTNRAH